MSVPESASVPEPVEGQAASVPEPVEGQLRTLIARATAADGSPPFSDGALVALQQGERELIRVEHGVAILDESQREAEFVVDPDARERGQGTALLENLLSRTGGELRVWAHGDHPAARALAASHGLVPVRELLHLSRGLGFDTPGVASLRRATQPAEEGVASLRRATQPAEEGRATEAAEEGRPAASVRAFRVGTDEGAWVEANSLIFAAHPEQGAVTVTDLAQLERESWFDPNDFLLLWTGDDLVGYCWLKLEPPRGEFYVVGVHPDRQGEHLGSLLFEAGLERMRARGIQLAHLYVEGDNEPALRLYRSRGFERDSIDIQYSTADPEPVEEHRPLS